MRSISKMNERRCGFKGLGWFRPGWIHIWIEIHMDWDFQWLRNELLGSTSKGRKKISGSSSDVKPLSAIDAATNPPRDISDCVMLISISQYLMFQSQLYALLRCQVHADVATGRGANCVLSSLCWCPYLGLSFLFHILFIIGPVCKDWTYNLIKITPFFGFSCQTVEHSTSKKNR